MGKPLKWSVRFGVLQTVITDNEGNPVTDNNNEVITTDDNTYGARIICDPNCFLYIHIWKWAISIGNL